MCNINTEPLDTQIKYYKKEVCSLKQKINRTLEEIVQLGTKAFSEEFVLYDSNEPLELLINGITDDNLLLKYFKEETINLRLKLSLLLKCIDDGNNYTLYQNLWSYLFDEACDEFVNYCKYGDIGGVELCNSQIESVGLAQLFEQVDSKYEINHILGAGLHQAVINNHKNIIDYLHKLFVGKESDLVRYTDYYKYYDFMTLCNNCDYQNLTIYFEGKTQAEKDEIISSVDFYGFIECYHSRYHKYSPEDITRIITYLLENMSNSNKKKIKSSKNIMALLENVKEYDKKNMEMLKPLHKICKKTS